MADGINIQAEEEINIQVEVDSATAICANHIDEITEVATIVDNIDELLEASTNINIVANNIEDVDRVGDNIGNVNAVAGNEANINAVKNNSTNINTVAGISGNVTTVAGISSSVTTVAGISSDVTAVKNNATNINAVAGNATNINAVNANKTNIDAVAGNATNINAVNSNKTNINTVAGISSNVTTVAGISSAVTAVNNNATNVNTVATNISNVNAVGGNISNVNAVAENATNINAVNSNKTNIDTCATNINAITSAPTYASNANASANRAAQSESNAATSAARAKKYADETHGASDVTFSNLRALPAINNYEYEQYDEDGLEDLIEAAHSSFDESKFTKSASWAGTITDDGIASGFSSSSYITYTSSATATSSLEIYSPKFKTFSASADDVILCLGDTTNFSFMISFAGTNPNYLRATSYFNGTSNNTDAISYAYPNPEVGSEYQYKLTWDGTTYALYLSVDGGEFSAVGTPVTSNIAPTWATGSAKIGVYFTGDLFPATHCSIDLKYFKITVDGIPVFSGNQTGIDVIKDDNYTRSNITKTFYCHAYNGVKVFANGTGASGSTITELYDYSTKHKLTLSYGICDYYFNGTQYRLSTNGSKVVLMTANPASQNDMVYTSADDTTVSTPNYMPITADGIASGFSTSNYLTKSNAITIGSSGEFHIDFAFKSSQYTSNQYIFDVYNTNTNEIILRRNANANSYTCVVFVNTPDIFNKTITTTADYIEGYIEYKNGTYKFSINGSTPETLVSSTKPTATTYNVTFGCRTSSSATDALVNGSIDLNAFKIYVNDDLKYQPCLKIPYTLSKDDRKIVDSIYKDRVFDMAEQYGYADYFTLQEDLYKNFEVNGNLVISNLGVVSGFSTSNYIKVNCASYTPSSSVVMISPTFNLSSLPQSGTYYIVNSFGLGLSVSDGKLSATGFDDFTIETDKNYTVKTEKISTSSSTTTINSYLSTNYGDWVLIGSVTRPQAISFDNTIYIGGRYSSGAVINAFNIGTLDINSFEIFIDGDSVYQDAITPPHFTTPQGSTYGYLQKLTRQNVTDPTSTSVTLAKAKGNTDYHYGTLTSLTITANETSDYETNIYFTAGNSISVSLPATLDYIGTTPSFSANESYVMSILNNILVIGEIA